jgi:hypothetical protein
MSEKIVEVHFEYGSRNENILTKQQLNMLQAICSKPVQYVQQSKRHKEVGSTNFWSDEDKNHPDAQILLDEYYIGSNHNIVPLNRLIGLGLPIKFSITTTIKETPEYNVEETLLHKLIELESKLSKFDHGAQFNQKVGVHISDLGLLSVREVTWLENECTEELQRYLNKGWRIIAVCPQPDSRRPDYILGRNSKED